MAIGPEFGTVGPELIRGGGQGRRPARRRRLGQGEESSALGRLTILQARISPDLLVSGLKADISDVAWATVNSTVSRPFPRPKSGRIAVKVINHYGDEVMNVIGV